MLRKTSNMLLCSPALLCDAIKANMTNRPSVNKGIKVKVKQEYSPVTLTFDTQQEFELFWEIVEETYPRYNDSREDDKRDLLVDISNAFSEKVSR